MLMHERAAPSALVLLWPRAAGSSQAYQIAACSVAGDVRSSCQDHALHNLGVPSTLLIFPGEGHSLSKNPWHGKIKVREELKWLQKYSGVAPRTE